MNKKEAAAIIDSVIKEINKMLEEPHYGNIESTIEGINGALKGDTPQKSHEQWAIKKRQDGWVHGNEKSINQLTHPCLVPYEKLPIEQKLKDCVLVTIAQFVNE